MTLVYFPNNVAAIMVALCGKKLYVPTSIPGEGGTHWRNITT